MYTTDLGEDMLSRQMQVQIGIIVAFAFRKSQKHSLAVG
jgi:hypothetical protein